MARELEPDVVLIDVVMPGASGIDAAAEISHVPPTARILMLSMQDDPSYVRQAFANGADRLRAQGCRRRRARHRRSARSPPASSTSTRRWARRLVGRPRLGQAGRSIPLSDREREVLSLLALGHTNQEIADQLYVSVRTVEAHRAHILTKLRLSTRAELVRYAIDTGLLND